MKCIGCGKEAGVAIGASGEIELKGCVSCSLENMLGGHRTFITCRKCSKIEEVIEMVEKFKNTHSSIYTMHGVEIFELLNEILEKLKS